MKTNVKKRILRTVSAMLLLIFFCSCLSACASRALPSAKGDLRVVGMVGEYEVLYEELRFLTLLHKDSLASRYGVNIWKNAEDTAKYLPELERLVYEDILANYAVLSLGAKEGFSIDDYAKNVQTYIDQIMELDFGGISVVRSAFSGGTAQNSMVLTFPRLAQYRLCNEIPKLYMLSTIGETCDVSMMNQGETIHYAQSTYNKMGKEMADNLANRLGIAKNKAKYSGVKVYAADGALLAAFDADGKLKEGSDVVSRGMASGKILIKLETLGTAYTIDTAVDGKKSDLIDKFGVLDWSKIPNVKKELKMVVTVD